MTIAAARFTGLIMGLGLGLGCSPTSGVDSDDEAAAESQAESTGDTDTSTSTSTSATSTGSTSTTSTFVPDSDTGSGIESCDPLVQDCPEGEKCVWYAPDEFSLRRDDARCIPITGELAPFEPCSLPTGTGPEVSDDCGAESFCLEVYATTDHGFCAPFAQDARGDACDLWPGTQFATENGSTFPAACLYYPCHPFLPETCPDDTRCVFYPAFLYGNNMCWKVPADADLPLGAVCDFAECGAGKLCAPAQWLPDCAGDRCCTQWCDLGDPSCSTPGTECEHFPVAGAFGSFENPAYDSLGACVLGGSLG